MDAAMTASFVTSRTRTEPWPHPDKADRHDVDMAHARLPYAEGWHAADNGHIAACPYSPVEEERDRAQWVDGWMARWSRLHPQSEGAPWTTGA